MKWKPHVTNLGLPGPPGLFGLPSWELSSLSPMVALVCSVSRGYQFHFWNLRIPWQPVASHWMWVGVLGCVDRGPPCICQICWSSRCVRDCLVEEYQGAGEL